MSDETVVAHQYDHTSYWTGEKMEVPAGQGLSKGWTFAAFPTKITKGKYVRFEGGKWVLTKTPRPQSE